MVQPPGFKVEQIPPPQKKKIAKNQEKEGENWKKTGKKREKRKTQEGKAKIGKGLLLCPSWQVGCTTDFV